MAEKLRSAIETLSLIPDQAITVSIGIATLQPGETRGGWMKRCDDKLYQAKSEGRNRISS
jgi:diguanylate cyclase (GGDEF)-like protein